MNYIMMSRAEFFAKVRGNGSCNYTTEQLYAAYEAYLTCPSSLFRRKNPAAAFDCGRCGNCCRRPWRVEVDLLDALRWIDEGRYDILMSLEPRQWGEIDEPDSDSIIIRQLAGKLAGEDDTRLATALSVASSLAGSEGSYVLPKNEGCGYLVEGEFASCSIHDTRPQVCRLFPGLR
jgi:Fe-S-cluster containining protein